MTKKQKRWLALGGVALAVGLLAWAFWPRTFAQTVGEGYDPSQIWEMQVTLNDVADPDRSGQSSSPPVTRRWRKPCPS